MIHMPHQVQKKIIILVITSGKSDLKDHQDSPPPQVTHTVTVFVTLLLYES